MTSGDRVHEGTVIGIKFNRHGMNYIPSIRIIDVALGSYQSVISKQTKATTSGRSIQ